MPAKTLFPPLLAASLATTPVSVMGDHVPDDLAQTLNPDYVSCMVAVEDATRAFRDALQATCLTRLGDICDGREGTAPPAEVIGCLHFEVERAVVFLDSAVSALPEETERKGFFGHGYKRRRDTLLKDIDTLKNQGKPQTPDAAVRQVVTMATGVSTFLWLARETGTPPETHVPDGFHSP